MEKRRTIWQAVVCVGLLCLIWGGYFFTIQYGTDRILEVKDDDFSWVYQVDSAKIIGKEFVLQGFAFALDENAEEAAFEIVLEDIGSGKRYFPKMEYTDRADVNEYFLCEFDYLQSGFSASIKAARLDLEHRNYEILLREAGERLTYRTGTYISKGEVLFVNPLEYKPLEVVDAGLKEVAEKGILKVYRPDYHAYVYQYAGALYWITEIGYGFDDMNDTYMQYHTSTTQIDKLPKHRLENNWYIDDLGFNFSKYEIKEYATQQIRVAKRDLPKEYSVTKVWTGNYQNGDWNWRNDFRPWYEFK